jgi:hypothetical protein
MSALYMSMSANETDLVIEDDLAKGEPMILIRDVPRTTARSNMIPQPKRFSAN